MSFTKLSCLLALLFGVRHFDTPRIGDAAVFATGLLSAWPEWGEQSPAVQRQLATFVLRKSSSIDSRNRFERLAGEMIEDGTYDLRFIESAEEKRYTYGGGKPLDPLIDALWDEFQAERSVREAAEPPDEQSRDRLQGRGQDRVIRVQDRHTTYEIPASHRNDLDPVALDPAPAADVVLQPNRLRTLAQRIADQNGEAKEHIPHVLNRFLENIELRQEGSADPDGVAVPNGEMQLVVAPTASGKSILSQLFAMDVAHRGTPTAVVVSDIQEVVDTVQAIEGHARDLGWKDLEVAPLFSPRSLFEKTADALQHGDGSVSNGEGDRESFVLNRLGYSCFLQAYAQDPDRTPDPGKEPCFRLGEDGTTAFRSCPVGGSCGRPALQRNALEADVVVVNHHSLLSGQCRYPVEFPDPSDRGPQEVSIKESLLHRCGLVLVDEVDSFQEVAVDMKVSSVSLYEADTAPTTIVEAQQAALQDGMIDLARPLAFVQLMAREIVTLIDEGDLDWPEWQSMRWSGQEDAWLVERLYGVDPTEDDGEAAYRRLEGLVGDAGQAELQSHEQNVRAALQPITTWSLKQPSERVRDHVLQLREALETWRWPEEKPSARERKQIEKNLFLRAALGEIEGAFQQIQARVARLLSADREAGRTLYNALQRFGAVSPSPAGLLQRHSYGFSFKKNDGDVQHLKIQGFAGDPHGEVRELGGITAQGVCAHKRAVVGLSASGHFAGSPLFDCDGANWLVQPDRKRQIQFYRTEAHKREPDRPSHRISGLALRSEREKETRSAAETLAPDLRRHVEELKRDEDTSADQLLAVTGSYDEARWVTRGLRNSGALETESDLGIRTVLPDDDPTDAPWRFRRHDIEQFPETEASVLVAPLKVVARRHNIVDASGNSALGAIYLMVRPVPPVGDVTSLLAYANYGVAQTGASIGVKERLDDIRRRAEAQRHEFQANATYLSRMKPVVRHHLMANLLVELLQLAGRARRGGTRADVHLVDGAFWTGRLTWPEIVSELLDWWRREGEYEQMKDLHGSLVYALEDLADRQQG